MSGRRVAGLASAAVAIALGGGLLAQIGVARVSTANTNVHAQPSESSPILGHATYGLELPLQVVEGEWCRVVVQAPADGARTLAYVRRFALTLTPEPPAAATPAVPGDSGVKMFVAADVAGKTRWLTPSGVRAVPITAAVESVAALAEGHAREIEDAIAGRTVLPADRSSDVTWLWAVARTAAPVVLAGRQPTLTAIYNDVKNFNPSDFAPALVRLAPMASPWRVLAIARGRADEASRAQADWPIGAVLKHEAVPARFELSAIGSMRIRLTAPLAPGEYAVILRPGSRKPIAGWRVFDESADGLAFSHAWLFAIR